jgi:hypothetical protein
MIKYASNAAMSAFTEISVLVTNYEFESRMSFDFIDATKDTARNR